MKRTLGIDSLLLRYLIIQTICIRYVAVAASASSSADSLDRPLLFMSLADVLDPWGRIKPTANSLVKDPSFEVPALNYTAGATVTAAFPVLPTVDSPPGASTVYEIFVAVGRPGEPLAQDTAPAGVLRKSASSHPRSLLDRSSSVAGATAASDGVEVLRFTTADFVTYSAGTSVLFLPNGSGRRGKYGDGAIWTVKSMARSDDGSEYLLVASYGASVHTFRSPDAAAPSSFLPTTGSLSSPNFRDHDDCNLIYHNHRWVDMQIMYQNTTTAGLGKKKYCDNIGDELRRVVTARLSSDGVRWSSDFGCADKPQIDEHCKSFNTTGMVQPDPTTDPPELEFYRIRPFRVGLSGRLAAHVLLYVPSPPAVVASPGYGRQPLWYCDSGCCHGPHMYEEWWVGPSSGDPADMAGWQRPFFDTPAAPHDTWLMAQPLEYRDKHVWVDNGAVWTLPLYRIAGLHSSSNAEFNTPAFSMPSTGLWINVDARWTGGNHVGGCDEGCAAYVMAELLNATTNIAIPGYERGNCIITNVDGLRVPLVWKHHGTTRNGSERQEDSGMALPLSVKLRLFFRQATVYAVGRM